MRILYIDIDSLRPDHIGAYGYHRNTTPNIDAIAAEGVRYENCHATDTPCLPSRTAMMSGRAGIHTGVINHGGVASEPFIQGETRGFQDHFFTDGWLARLRDAGYWTAGISPFGERHSAWHWMARFNEQINTGKGGMESAEEVMPEVMNWFDRRGADDKWFLHMNLWDPHTPYRAPAEFGNPFANDPLPEWYTEDVRQKHWAGCGPHSAREVNGFGAPHSGWTQNWDEVFPRQPHEIKNMDKARKMFDGYDCGVAYADQAVGQIVARLKELGVYEETAIIITADHGENLGELNIYGDHQTADRITTRIPMIIRWPGVTDTAENAGRCNNGLIYHLDAAATVTELAGGKITDLWDGDSHADSLKKSEDWGRDTLVVGNGAWSCQRGVRWDKWHLVRSYHEGFHNFPEFMLFDIDADPHEQHDLAESHPEVVNEGMKRLDQWHAEMMRCATHADDPMRTVMNEGGSFHANNNRDLIPYIKRLRETERGHLADEIIAKHPEAHAMLEKAGVLS